MNADTWISRQAMSRGSERRKEVIIEVGHYISWNGRAPYASSTDRVLPIASALRSEGAVVYIQIAGDENEKNISVNFLDISGKSVCFVDNIRTLSKSNADPMIVMRVLGKNPSGLDIEEDF